jgi:hypothetical protein
MARPSEEVEYDVLFLQGRSGAMHISILGIDIGKNSGSVVGVDDCGADRIRREAANLRDRDGCLLWRSL